MAASLVSSPYDVLGDASEYEEWLALQKPSAPAFETKETHQDVTVRQIQEVDDLPADIAHVVVHLEPQHAATVLSVYQGLQRSRYVKLTGLWSCCFECIVICRV